MFKVYKEDKTRCIQSDLTECTIEFVDSFAVKTAAIDYLKEKCVDNLHKYLSEEEEFSYEFDDNNMGNDYHHSVRYYIEECNTIKNGEKLIDVSGLDYDFIDDFHFERAIVRRHGAWGIIDTNFEPILFCDEYNRIAPYEERSAANGEPFAEISIDKGKRYYHGLVDVFGNFVVRANGGIHRVPSRDIFWAFNESATKWVKVLVSPDTFELSDFPYTEYDECSFYDVERRVFMRFGDFPTLGDPFGVEGFALAIGGFEGDVARFSFNEKVGVIDSEENIVVEPKYKQIQQFSDGLAAVKTFSITKLELLPGGKSYKQTTIKNSKWGFINKLGKEVIPPQYDMVYPFSAGHAPFNIGGLIESIQTVEVPEEYEYLFSNEDTHVSIFKGGKWGFINVEGEVVVPPEYDECTRFIDGRVAIIGKNNKFGLITADFKYQTGLLYTRIRYDESERILRPSFIAETENYDEDGYRLVTEWSIYDGPEGFVVKKAGMYCSDYD